MLHCSSVTDVGSLIESAGFRLLDNMKAVALAVSGIRKVACVVSMNDNALDSVASCVVVDHVELNEYTSYPEKNFFCMPKII